MDQSSESITGLDSKSVENYQVLGASQGHASIYASLTPGHHSFSTPTGQASVTWNYYRQDNAPKENGIPSSSGYHYDPHKEMNVSGDGQDGTNPASHASTSSSLSVTHASPGYPGYASYSSSTDPYGYGNMGYQNYYAYQQPASDSSSQQVGANQNSGAPYQSHSSFQNTASYADPTSYSGTYYGPGDHQTTAGYQNVNYTPQSSFWNGGGCGTYPLHHYPNYTASDTNSTQTTSSVAANSLHYQQQYDYWSYYYGTSAPNSSSAPGAESTLAKTASTSTFPVQGASGGYPYPSSQPPPPGTTSWTRDSGTSGLASLQEKSNSTTYNPDGGWDVGTSGTQNYQMNQTSAQFQNPLDSNSLSHEKCEDQQKIMYTQGPTSQLSSTNQAPEKFHPPLQSATVLDAHRVSKMQIPTNPRIPSSLTLGMPKVDKESSTTNTSLKPAYISVSAPKISNKLPSHDDAEAIMKGTFPAPLRAYVERTFARCKDDSQRAANQSIMKEIITKATADGTLFTRNWDIEPLFPLPNPNLDVADGNNLQSSVTVSSLPKFKRSPNRRVKSRWEPIAEEKLVEKLAPVTYDLAIKGADRVAGVKKHEIPDNGWNGMKFISSEQQSPLSKVAQRPVKKPRFADNTSATANGDASSDSDKEQGLTKYYSSAITLANSPEEKKRREHRFKRFEKGQENQAEIKHYRPKVAGAGNIYIRRANAMQMAKSYEDGSSRAVEDIDWNALTVKGTCQEVEKRYLRLTSAPDPTTVRPEEVLEKALHMVQTSQKNYLFKCDQLKSIRQDLTVQRIQNELTVKVYETHARLALEAGDLPEYNQCQSQLKSLYAEGIKGCDMEFAAYNLLCVILHSNNNRDLLSAMRRLSNESKKDEAVKHALAVRSAVSSGNYILFFRLYKTAPNLSTCLMDLYVEKMRFEAIKCISKSYRPTVSVSYIALVLGFSRAMQSEYRDNKDTNGLEECEEWLRAHGAVLIVENNGELHVDTKVSSSSLYMPEPEDAVAHGDATLAVDDFLTRAPS